MVLKALARKREDRYATALEFARALERAAGPLIWHPEQSGELMQRLFADRREQTRALLEPAVLGRTGRTPARFSSRSCSERARLRRRRR